MRQSQAVQRDMPRPSVVNDKIMRPHEQLQNLSEMQRAEELIKAEMLTMLHNDAVKFPSNNSGKATQKQLASEMAKHQEYLKTKPLLPVADSDLEIAKQMLDKEMANVQTMVGHGELSMDAYTKVWEECYGQVLYLPSQQHFGRTSLASKRERIESLEKRLELHRNFMSEEAKRAGKLEKKLRVTHGGYLMKFQQESKQLTDLFDQLEQARMELSTFSMLRQHETAAIPRRIAGLREDVQRQEQREKQLQDKYDRLKFEKDSLKVTAKSVEPRGEVDHSAMSSL